MNGSSGKLEDFKSPFVKDREDDAKLSKTIHDCINRIMATLSFRKLAGKTQVILSINGPDVRTRLTHTMEVAKIARDLCRDLGLNPDLAEAIALAHDLGHTPFGHVGERTLTDIMCGCNTLDGKVQDDDFGNAGFKHNLQSFRVLWKDLGYVDDGVWPYIFWGALAHTKMTYAGRLELGNIDNDISISSFYCKRIYNCHFSSTHECRRNDIKRNPEDGRLCKPWFCAIQIEHNNKLRQDVMKHLSCEEACYMAKLWKAKIERRAVFQGFPFFFDHPFPNIYYADFMKNNLLKTQDDWVSLEALIVSQADEIAQRRQDLEDAVNKRLLSIGDAKKAVKGLMKPFIGEEGIEQFYCRINNCNNSLALGENVSNFYQELLRKSTSKNIRGFTDDTKKTSVNIYALMDIFFNTFVKGSRRKREWIFREMDSIQHDKPIELRSNDYFNWVDTEALHEAKDELYSIAFEMLESGIKSGAILGETDLESSDIQYDTGLLNKLIVAANNYRTNEDNNFCSLIYTDKGNHIDKVQFLKTVDEVHESLKLPRHTTKIKLFHYYVISNVYDHFQAGNDIDSLNVIQFADMLAKHSGLVDRYANEKNAFFHKWKRLLGIKAHQALSRCVQLLCYENDKEQIAIRERAIKDFEKSQKSTIINSEIIEKNDGKGSYILRRLFKAYRTNPHQLPDTGLEYILEEIKDKYDNLVQDERLTFEAKINSLKLSLFMTTEEKDHIVTQLITLTFITDEISATVIENTKKRLSNELRALWDEERALRAFLNMLKSESPSKDNATGKVAKRKLIETKVHKTLRGILDNAMLGAIPVWRSILIRGICDYIASLTDQEAISEYEKLYTGVMELV